MSHGCSSKQRRQASSDVRLYCRWRGTNTLAPNCSSLRTTCVPRKPAPPVTVTRLSVQKLCIRATSSVQGHRQDQVGVDIVHFACELAGGEPQHVSALGVPRGLVVPVAEAA